MSYSIQVISLSDDASRRKAITSQASMAELKFRFIDAVDGRKLPAIEYFSDCKNDNFWFNRRSILTPSELGCFLSHKKSIGEFISEGKSEWLVVLEDDVLFDHSFKDYLDCCFSELDKSSLLILGGQEGLPSFKRVISSKSISKEIDIKKVRFYTHRWLYRTCCFAIHRSKAIDLLNLYSRSNFVVDDWAYVVKNAGFSGVFFTSIVRHPIDLSGSLIEEERRAK